MNRIFSAVVGCLVMFLAVGIVAALFTFELPPGNREVALVILGTVIGWAGAVVSHEFGSSAGSARKTEIMANGKKEE